MLHLRIISAIVGIPLILGLIYLGDSYYALFILLVANLGMYEYTAMLGSRGYHLPAFLGFAGVSIFLAMVYLAPLLQQELIYPALITIVISLSLLVLIFFEKTDFTESALIFWGIIYLGGLCGYLILLRRLPEGMLFTYLLFIGIWLNDTLAYFIGMKWGRRRLAPSISPRKSVEGSLAGIIGTTLLFYLAATFLADSIGLSPVEGLLLGLVITVFGQLGDLVESAMKRKFAVKDTGNLIPGHGGVLDRFDSLLFAAPLVYYYAQLLVQG